MSLNGLGVALRTAYDACVDDCREADGLDRSALRQAMVLYVEKEHADTVREHLTQMLYRMAEEAIKRRHHASRPSAAAIRRATDVVSGQLPMLDGVLTELYDLPDGRTVSLGDMTVAELRMVVTLRTKQRDEDTAILGRLELILSEAERRGVKIVRELLVAS